MVQDADIVEYLNMKDVVDYQYQDAVTAYQLGMFDEYNDTILQYALGMLHVDYEDMEHLLIRIQTERIIPMTYMDDGKIVEVVYRYKGKEFDNKLLNNITYQANFERHKEEVLKRLALRITKDRAVWDTKVFRRDYVVTQVIKQLEEITSYIKGKDMTYDRLIKKEFSGYICEYEEIYGRASRGFRLGNILIQ